MSLPKHLESHLERVYRDPNISAVSRQPLCLGSWTEEDLESMALEIRDSIRRISREYKSLISDS